MTLANQTKAAHTAPMKADDYERWRTGKPMGVTGWLVRAGLTLFYSAVGVFTVLWLILVLLGMF